jgi:hypothetical protein
MRDHYKSRISLAYEARGALERAIPMLEQSKRDFPADYSPPSRLGKVQLELGRGSERGAVSA